MADISAEALQTVKSALNTFQTDISGLSLRSANYADSIIKECKGQLLQTKSEITKT